jgi:hypothetical protein
MGSGSTRLTNSNDIDCDSLDLEPAGKLIFRKSGLETAFFEIHDRFTVHTNQVMVVLFIEFHPQRPMMQAHFAQHSAAKKGMDVLVDGGQRNRWNSLLYLVVNRFRAGVYGHSHHSFIDQLPLVSGGQMVPTAKLAKLHSGVRHGNRVFCKQ